MAYLIAIHTPKCTRCTSAGRDRRATQELRTNTNALYGTYCDPCADVMLRLAKERETATYR